MVRRRTRQNRWRLSMCAATLAYLAMARHARADVVDPFWGPDKALHFAVAGAIAGAGYGITTQLTAERWKAFAVGAGAALGAGALKEGLDAAGMGDPSWKDFAWDVLGAAAGLGVAWLVDSAARSDHPQVVTSAGSALLPAGVALHF